MSISPSLVLPPGQLSGHDREETFLWTLAHELRVRVRDTGRGIDAAALPRIFDLFEQETPSAATGVGIGLSVVREIVTLHGGSIEARSAGLGLGSEFVVTLPSRADVSL